MNEATDKDIVEYYKGKDELLIKTARNNYDKGYEAAQEEIIKILDLCEAREIISQLQNYEIKHRIKEE